MRQFVWTLMAVALLAGMASADDALAPYAADAQHPWNRLHRALFLRADPKNSGRERAHVTDPFLYTNSMFLLQGEPHREAVARLDEFLAAPIDTEVDHPLKRLFLQHDLWAAFDHVAWYPDDWVHHSRHEAAAVALRTRLARAIGRLSLTPQEIDALPDNYALAVASKQYAIAHDPQHPERPFLPPDLFDPAGPWVRFHNNSARPMAHQHFRGAGGRAVHVIFLSLPGGRAATERYLKDFAGREPLLQFPPGTKVAMVRRALTVDREAKVRLTPVTELVQIRVYRRIPADPKANHHGDYGEQDVYEFDLDRGKLFAGQPGLRALGPDDPPIPFDRDGVDPFNGGPGSDRLNFGPTALKTCTQCHQRPGVFSILSIDGALRERARGGDGGSFPTYAWDVEVNYTVRAKVDRFEWGLLRGMLETTAPNPRQP